MIVLNQSNELFEKVKLIFGEDIVKNAYFTTHKTEDCLEKDVINRLNDSKKHVYLDNNYLCMDNQEIIIEFSNGRKINFGNSEWGGIEFLNPKENEFLYL